MSSALPKNTAPFPNTVDLSCLSEDEITTLKNGWSGFDRLLCQWDQAMTNASRGMLGYEHYVLIDEYPTDHPCLVIIRKINDLKKAMPVEKRAAFIQAKISDDSPLSWATQRIIQSKRNGNKLACFDEAHALEKAGYALAQANACGLDIRTWPAFLTSYPI